MAYEVRIERDSITTHGERLTTFVCTFPRFILAEVNTHRMLSRSSASSRAIPVEKQLARLENDPFYPVSWGKNQKGMQAGEELSEQDSYRARDEWATGREESMRSAVTLRDLGVHKQIANRLLEPHMWHTAIITATEWDNFWHLRNSALAQPEFKELAAEMHRQYTTGSPILTSPGVWHLPFITEEECQAGHVDFIPMPQRIYVSIGRCARVSYLTHDGKRDIQADIDLAERRLRPSGHMAPFEHAAYAMSETARLLFRKYAPVPDVGSSPANPQFAWDGVTFFCGNFRGWVQARKTIPNEWDACAP